MPQTRVTLGQIATRVGLHITTVSLALRDSPRLPASTRHRVQAAAREMGYAPDPALNALNAYRSQVRAPAFQATLAWFNNYPRRAMLFEVPTFREYHAGALQRASELGYKLEEVWLHEPGLTPAALRRRLLARGISGILVFPQLAPAPFPDFAWEDFSAVAFGYSLTAPQLHRVTNHHFRSALILLRQLRELGYRRIGLFLPEPYDRRVNLGPSSAYAAYDASLPAEERVPLLVQHEETAPRPSDILRFHAWVRDHRPEVVICQNIYVREWLLAKKLRVPEDIGLARLNIAKGETILSGVHQSDQEIGRAAVDFLVAMLHRNERGVPAIAQHILIDGVWLPRQTTRRVGPPAPWFLDQPGASQPATSTPPASRRRTPRPRTRA